jgi:TolA-binding protein
LNYPVLKNKNKIKNLSGLLINRLDKTEERVSQLEDKVDELEHSENIKEKRSYEQRVQNL